MVLTVQEIITEALGLVGVCAAGETPDDTQSNLALRTLNIMLGNWAARRLMLRGDTNITFSTTIGKEAYTIGASVSLDVNRTKPLKINSGYVTYSNIDYPLEVISTGTYDALGDKSISPSRPVYVAYDPGVAQQATQTGTIYLYYSPDKVYPVTLSASCYFTEFATLGETVTIEPIYYEPLVYNLAVRLHRQYHSMSVPVPQDVAIIAHESMRTIMNLNSIQPIATIDIPSRTGKYNIYTDGA